MSDLVAFDPNTVAQKLREKIRTGLMELIPDEKWDELIKAELYEFTRPRDQSYWTRQSHRSPSHLEQMIQDQLRKLAQELLDEHLKKEWREWGRGQLSQRVKELVAEHGADILMSVLSQTIQDAVNRMSVAP